VIRLALAAPVLVLSGLTNSKTLFNLGATVAGSPIRR